METALAVTINVPAEQPTIQAAIDRTKNGDTVLVANGTYKGKGNVNLNLRGKSIIVKSKFGARYCIIDCEENEGSRAFLLTSGETRNSIIDGFTMINGNTETPVSKG
jgi:hypothetical protein